MSDHWYQYNKYNGCEKFRNEDLDLDFSVLDFWRYAYSNLIDIEPEIAEFLVGRALGLEIPTNKAYWTPFDIQYGEVKIEVKETGYTHTWTKKQSKMRRFDIKPSKGGRQCDIYVFCLVGEYGEIPELVNPLDLSIWKFFVVPRKVIDDYCGEEKSLSLGKLFSLGYESIPYKEIKAAVDNLVNVL